MRKALRRRLYNALHTPGGALVVLVGGFACCLALLACVHAAIDSVSNLKVQASVGDEASGKIPTPCHQIEGTCASRFSDNIVGQSFEEELCSPVIDVVYTWVNGSDPRLQTELLEWKQKFGLLSQNESIEDQKGNSNRYRDNQELRYSLRSIWKFAPWVRRIFVVTNYQVPHWLNIDHPKIDVIPHSHIFPNKSHLPVFSSPAIESHLHRIPGLAKKFIYFNDDVMLGNTIWPSDFYTNTKGQKIYLSWDIPQCAPGCPEAWLADKYCDKPCNTSLCNWDEGDCRTINGSRFTSWHFSQQANPSSFRHKNSNRAPATPKTPNVGEGETQEVPKAKKCHRFCPDSWIGDKVCDNSCNRVECGFDAGDCGIEDIQREILGLSLAAENEVSYLPYKASAFYVNLTDMFEVVLDASHDNQDFVRAAIITQELHILVFLLHEKHPLADWDEAIEVYLEGERNGGVRNVTFLIARSYERDSDSDGFTQNDDNNVPDAAAKTAAIPSDETAGGEQETDEAGETDASATESTETDDTPSLSSNDDEGADKEGSEDEGLGSDGAGSNSRNLLWIPVQTATEGHTYQTDTHTHSDIIHINNNDDNNKYNQKITYVPTADIFDIVKRVGSVPDGKGGTIPKEQWNWEDQQLAEQIGEAKRKRLASDLIEEALRTEKDEIRSQVESGFRRSEVILPNEMERRVSERVAEWLEEDMIGDQPPNARKLLEDTFGNSLRYVNTLYRARYGSEQRKAPAHMPHMIDRDVMSELQGIFPKEFDATSTHRFRDSEDMQFSFSYFYYLMNEKPPFDLERIFRENLDLNKDGVLDMLEIRHLTLMLMPGKPTVFGMRSRMSQMMDDLKLPRARKNDRNLKTDQDVIQHRLAMGEPVTFERIKETPKIVDQLKKHARKQTKYKHELVTLNEVEFFMVPDDYDQVQERLDHIMVKAPKFICLNDDMNKTHDPPARTLKALRDFYTTYYPDPTPFELPEDQFNPYLHYEELMEYKQKEHKERIVSAN